MAPTADGTAPASKDPGNGDAPSAPTTFYRRRPPPGEERARALSHTMRFPDGDGAAEITRAYQPPPGDMSGLAGTSRERPDARARSPAQRTPSASQPLNPPFATVRYVAAETVQRSHFIPVLSAAATAAVVLSGDVLG